MEPRKLQVTSHEAHTNSKFLWFIQIPKPPSQAMRSGMEFRLQKVY